MLAIGAIKDSIVVFTELRMWEKVALCYRIVREESKAEKIIRQCISDNPSPRLYCVLGDIKKDISQYKKAWELSGYRYPRAAASIGAALYKEGKVSDYPLSE